MSVVLVFYMDLQSEINFYNYDDRMIAHMHVFMYKTKIDCECSALLITLDNVNTFWTCILYI